jgi:diguanylate cyclase (GGDEF)-like protein
LDIDDFKKYNDRFGHIEGDKVLARSGKLIQASLRKTDSAYRYGGEEFTVIMPETDGQEAQHIAERIRKAFAAETFRPNAQETQRITASIGIAEYRNGEKMLEFIKRADKNMYTAKKQGKDRIYFSE